MFSDMLLLTVPPSPPAKEDATSAKIKITSKADIWC